MSGGSLDYVYHRVTDAADTIRRSCPSPLHQAFAAHLDKVSKALHDVEWVLSCDYGEDDDEAAIKAIISPEDVLARAVDAAISAKTDLEGAFAALAASIARPAPLTLLDPADDEAMEWVTNNLCGVRRDNGSIDYGLTAVVRAFQAGKSAATAPDEPLRTAVEGIADDYMTSEKHHPGYVLIPTAKFDEIRAAVHKALSLHIATEKEGE